MRHLFLFLTYIFTLTYKIFTRKSLDPRKTHEKNFRIHDIPKRRNLGAQKMGTRKILGPTMYPRQETLDPRNTHKKDFGPAQA